MLLGQTQTLLHARELLCGRAAAPDVMVMNAVVGRAHGMASMGVRCKEGPRAQPSVFLITQDAQLCEHDQRAFL